ncbi:MAG: hypothetical protein ACQEWW_22925 [Bacillota bacterium]
MNKSSFIESRFFAFMDITYKLIKSSLLFWGYLFKNFLIFGVTVSFCTLIEAVNEIFSGNGQPIRELFREISPKYRSTKKLSLIIFGLIIYLSAFIILPFPASISSYFASVIKFALIYIFLLTLVLFTNISWVLIKMNLSLKQSVMYGFYLLVKRFFRTMVLILIMLIISFAARMNFIFLFFFAPSIYAMCVRFVLRKY